MLDELQPLGLKEAALQLGVDPFELMRLLVVNDMDPDQLRFTTEQIDELRRRAGLENWWADNGVLPEDANARRARVRATLEHMVQHNIVGSSTTRLDNIWRGLAEGDRMLLEQAITVLVQEGHLSTFANPQGVQISVNPNSLPHVQAIASGRDAPASLSALWQG